jgi:asparagine synthase (glutamine-hydrolysing)
MNQFFTALISTRKQEREREGGRKRQRDDGIFCNRLPGKSIACSMERAMNWDASFSQHADLSGRATNVVYDGMFVTDTKLDGSEEHPTKKAKA